MQNNYNKPNYIPECFLVATKHGWVDSRTNEILVAIPRLNEKVEQKPKKRGRGRPRKKVDNNND